MKKIFVVFGSASDENVALPLVEALKNGGFDVEYAVISAHRNLEQLRDKMARWDGDAVVAGAGLAAALPGVVAAMTDKPVIGLPVAGQFGGLDSLASIAQMPPGVPVLCSAPNAVDDIAAYLAQWRGADRPAHVHFVVPQGLDAASVLQKAEGAANERKMTMSSSADINENAFNVFCVADAAHVRPKTYGLHMPLMAPAAAAEAKNYIKVFDWVARGGLWVGVNNARNAIHGAARLKGAA